MRLIDWPARHLCGTVGNRSGRTRIICITDGRRALAQGRDLERKIGTAHARAFDRLDLNDPGADLDGTRFQTFNLGLVPPGRPFAGHEAAPAAGERQQQTCADEIETHATFHTRKNASSFFNEASTPVAGDFVKDKKSLPKCAPYLEPLAAFGSHHDMGTFIRGE